MTTNHTPVAWPSRERLVVTDAGLETWLLFHKGIELPAFAAYPLAGTAEGRAVLVEYYEHYLAIADALDLAIDLETPTWRANPEWAATLGHDRATLSRLIAASVEVVADLRTRRNNARPFLIGGTIGPRGDGYRIDTMMTAEESQQYHGFQVDCLADAGVDVVTALTMGYVEEAIGIVRAAEAAGVPAVVSFTLETDGRLPSGMSLAEAIAATDAATGSGAIHYMINCAHPTHFDHVLKDEPWVSRIGGVRANASSMSHSELDEMTELDEGNPDDLATRYVALRRALPSLQVIGGCCGTDHRHVAVIAAACLAATAA